MLSQQLLDSLGGVGLTRMSPKGQPFDPELHEAVSHTENGDFPEHTVVEVYQDGYMLKDRVIRPAQVVVSTLPAAAPTELPVNPSGEENSNPFQQASS
jgi:molecular chaperone GrpE